MTSLSPVPKTRIPLEREVHRDVKRAYEAVGCFVANLAQGYRPGGKRHATTRQTKGIPDLYVFPPLNTARYHGGHRSIPVSLRDCAPFWHEVKRPGGEQSPEQRAWEVECKERSVGYVCGGVPEALEHLRKIGLVLS